VPILSLSSNQGEKLRVMKEQGERLAKVFIDFAIPSESSGDWFQNPPQILKSKNDLVLYT
jgi:hypothetical protein